MINVIFNDKKATGFSLVNWKSSNSNKIGIEKSEQELTDLLSDILEEGETWRDKYKYLSLDEDEEVYLDRDRFVEDLKEQYENDEITEEELEDKKEQDIITQEEYDYITGEQ